MQFKNNSYSLYRNKTMIVKAFLLVKNRQLKEIITICVCIYIPFIM